MVLAQVSHATGEWKYGWSFEGMSIFLNCEEKIEKFKAYELK
jgi:hypothetical protein